MDLGPLGAAADESVMAMLPSGRRRRRGPARAGWGWSRRCRPKPIACASCPRAAAPLIHVSGGSALRARAGAEGLRQKGVAGLVSFGLAIGLAPVLRPGDVVVADSVVLPSGRSIATDAGVARGAARSVSAAAT